MSVCSHVAAATASTVPATYRHAVQAAADVGLVDADLARSLSSAVGLRNLLVHEYARADLDVVAASVPVAERDLSEFVRQVANWLLRRA